MSEAITPPITPDGAVNNTEPTGQKPNDQTPPETPKTFTQEEVNRLVGKARGEEKTRLQKEIDDAKLSESERIGKENAELKNELRISRAKDVVSTAATKAGATNTAALFLIAQPLIKFDNDGAVSNLKEVIDEAKSLAPELFQKKTPTGNGNGGEGSNTQRQGSSMNDFIRQGAGRQPQQT